MEVRIPGHGLFWFLFFPFIFVFQGVLCFCLAKNSGDVVIGIVVFLFWGFLAVYQVLNGISSSRVISFEDTGVNIFLFDQFVRRYRWDQLKTKIYLVKNYGTYNETIIFYVNDFPANKNPKEYSIWHAPLSLIYINLVDNPTLFLAKYNSSRYVNTNVFLASKTEFLSMLDKYGVKVERIELKLKQKNGNAILWVLGIIYLLLFLIIGLVILCRNNVI